MIIEEGSKILFIGDSITDANRLKPIASQNSELGTGYVLLIDSLLTAYYPEKKFQIINMGISGNTVKHLKERWDKDVIALRPDWLSIMIGINDVWRQFDRPFHSELHVYKEEYEKIYRELLQKTRSYLKGLVLMTPFFIEPNKKDKMRMLMDEYGEIVKRLAKEFDAVLVDVQKEFDEFLKYYHPTFIAKDRIHPNMIGHTIIAKAFLQSIGFNRI